MRSHSLRFAVKRSLGNIQQFRQRINRAAEAEEDGRPVSLRAAMTGCSATVRDRGSIHSDIWRGSAAALADARRDRRVSRERLVEGEPGFQRWERSARYALLVSVRAPGANIDIYTPIANQLAISIPAA